MRAYGVEGLTLVDRFGVMLSRQPIRKVVRRYPSADVLDIGCGFQATQLRDLAPIVHSGMGVDSRISDEAKAVPNLRFAEGSAEQLLPTLPAASFDIVMMISVL
jgi:ubiquinone/menaquinone biosynthesis C-methylase UbiE